MNEQKFLTELSKLLTFMYEEDRQVALSMYEQMFSFADDETALLQFLGSPTKQAVMIARAYNAKERKLAVTSQSGERQADIAGNETPAFVRTIMNIHTGAENLELIRPEVIEDQISIFGKDEEDEDLFVPEEEPAAVVEEPEVELPSSELPELSLEMPEEAASFLADAEGGKAPEQDTAAPTKKTEEKPELPEDSPAETYMLDLGPVPEKPRSEESEINITMAAFDQPERKQKAEESAPAAQTTLSEFEQTPPEPAHPWRKEAPPQEVRSGKPSTLLLILYLIAAVPIVSAGVLILLVPALVFFALAVFTGISAFRVLMLAFGNFAVFADIMVVLGASLVLFALALLLFWIFLWFVISAISGLINAAIRLGGKICYKEGKDV